MINYKNAYKEKANIIKKFNEGKISFIQTKNKLKKITNSNDIVKTSYKSNKDNIIKISSLKKHEENNIDDEFFFEIIYED